MKEQLITFETAQLAKERGFDAPSKCYHSDGSFQDRDNLTDYNSWPQNTKDEFLISAPTQSLLQKWLREIHIHINVCPHGDYKLFLVEIYHPTETNKSGYTPIEGVRGNTYEEALEKGLIEALKLIKS